MKFFKKYKGILLTLLGLLAALAAGAFLYMNYLLSSTQKIEDLNKEDLTNANISEEAQEIMKGYWTIALFGVDSREGELDKGTLSDVEIICNVDRATGEIRLVSVYRDTLLKVSKKGKYDKINSAYLTGGPAQAVWALGENLDMSFDDCIAFNWKAVADAINILGGIDINITKDEFKLINGFITETVESTGIYSTHLTHDGENHLDGVQSVAYARLRKLDTDFKRTERQRTVIMKALEKAKEADFATLNNIMVTVLPQMKSTITIDDLIPMAKNISRYHIGASTGFPFELTDKKLDKKDVVIPISLESNVKELHKFLYDDNTYKPSDKVIEISEKIETLSGTGSGKSSTKEGSTTGTKAKADEVETKPKETKETVESSSVEESTTSGSSSRGENGPGQGTVHARPQETKKQTGPGIATEPENEATETAAPEESLAEVPSSSAAEIQIPETTQPAATSQAATDETPQQSKEIGPGVE